MNEETPIMQVSVELPMEQAASMCANIAPYYLSFSNIKTVTPPQLPYRQTKADKEFLKAMREHERMIDL